MEKNVYDRFVLNRIREILKDFSPQVQKVIHMRMEGYSYYEISAETEINENSARVTEFRVRTRIKQILKEEGLKDD